MKRHEKVKLKLCSNSQCLKKATHFFNDGIKVTKNGLTYKSTIRLCDKHYLTYRAYKNKKLKQSWRNKKTTAINNAKNWFVKNDSKIRELTTNQEYKLIKNFYNNDYLQNNKHSVVIESFFALLVHDLINMNNGDAVREYPFFFKNYKRSRQIKPNFCDVYCRYYKLAIETKASFFKSKAQNDSKYLRVQKTLLKKYFKTNIMILSPDGHTEHNLLDLLTYLNNVNSLKF